MRRVRLKLGGRHLTKLSSAAQCRILLELLMGVKKSGKGRRKLGQKKRRMRAKIRHRKG
jgi:hypothetical protein